MSKRKSTTSTDRAPATADAHSCKRKKSHANTRPPSNDGPYTTAQQSAILEFTGVTQSDKSSAARVLKQYKWNVGAAINAYFNNPQSNGANNTIRTSLNKIFDKYRDDPKGEPDEINIEGVQNLLGELEIGLDDIGALIFSELVQSPSLGKLTREGFVDGFQEVNVDSLPRMRNIVLQRRSQLQSDKTLFKAVYNHTFQLALQGNSKILPLEMAMEFWKLVFSPAGMNWSTRNSPWLEWWFEFLDVKGQKAVNRDLWKQTLNFAQETIKDDSLGFWSEDSSWPSVIDDFVGWCKTVKGKQGSGGDAMED